MELSREIHHARANIYQHPKPLPLIVLPQEQHLLITTEKRIYSWCPQSIKTEFCSRDGGIVTAKEAANGSGILAVADSHVVILSKTSGPRKKYTLKAEDGRVCLISFANGYQDIIFSTSMQTSLRRYSITQDRLLEFDCTHPSPPNVLAVSSNSNYIVSASNSPPIIYLQDLRIPGSKILVKPHASYSSVAVASFHPGRDEIFLLGYADGTLSVHTASRIVLMRLIGSDGNIGHLKGLSGAMTNARGRKKERKTYNQHSSSSGTVVVGDKAISIAAAAFMVGYKLRVVSVTGDGKCRVVDFEQGASILRTWHVRAPCTSLAIFSPKSNCTSADVDKNSTTSSQRKRIVSSSYIIAIGRTDGYLLLYDALGLLRGHILVGHGRERVIDLDWVSDATATSLAPESTLQSSVADVEWTFKDAPKEPFHTTSIRNSAQESGSPQSRLIDSLRSSRTRLGVICTPERSDTIVKPADKQKIQAVGAASGVLDEFLPKEAGSPPGAIQSDMERQGLSDPNLDPLRTPALSVIHSPKTMSGMPCEWVESSSSFGSLPTEALKRSLLSPDMSQKLVPLNTVSEAADENHSDLGHNGQRSSQMPFRRISRVTSIVDHQRQVAPIQQSVTLPTARQKDVEESPTRKECRNHGTKNARVGSMKCSATSQIGHGASPHQQLCESYLTNPGDSVGLGEPEQVFSVPAAPPSSPLLLTKPLPELPKTDSLHGCDCDCSEVIREEMVLMRAEISALRKSIWVFGGQIERASLR